MKKFIIVCLLSIITSGFCNESLIEKNPQLKVALENLQKKQNEEQRQYSFDKELRNLALKHSNERQEVAKPFRAVLEKLNHEIAEASRYPSETDRRPFEERKKEIEMYLRHALERLKLLQTAEIEAKKIEFATKFNQMN